MIDDGREQKTAEITRVRTVLTGRGSLTSDSDVAVIYGIGAGARDATGTRPRVEMGTSLALSLPQKALAATQIMILNNR